MVGIGVQGVHREVMGLTEPDRDDWDPRDPSVLADQRRAYDEMRHSCPVAHSDFVGWSLFRHEDVVRVLEDPATYSSASRHAAIPNGIDPPAHGRFRAALAPHFADERRLPSSHAAVRSLSSCWSRCSAQARRS